MVNKSTKSLLLMGNIKSLGKLLSNTKRLCDVTKVTMAHCSAPVQVTKLQQSNGVNTEKVDIKVASMCITVPPKWIE